MPATANGYSHSDLFPTRLCNKSWKATFRKESEEEFRIGYPD